MREYIEAEHLDKKKEPLADIDDWETMFNAKTPQQDNGSDCGVFSCQTLEAVARGRDLKNDTFGFKAQDMSTIRKMMIYELGTQKLVERKWGI